MGRPRVGSACVVMRKGKEQAVRAGCVPVRGDACAGLFCAQIISGWIYEPSNDAACGKGPGKWEAAGERPLYFHLLI